MVHLVGFFGMGIILKVKEYWGGDLVTRTWNTHKDYYIPHKCITFVKNTNSLTFPPYLMSALYVYHKPSCEKAEKVSQHFGSG